MADARKFGEYTVVRLLGKGGMSEVYEVEHGRVGSRHALKLFTYMGDVAEVRDRFLSEGKLLARLAHPRIVKVTDVGVAEDSGRPYFVMDLILDADGEAKSLADVPAGGADEEEVARWYEDLRDGLSYIHGKGIIHRDLKLQNVLIGPDGHVVLTDFGISKITDKRLSEKLDPVQTVVRVRDGKNTVMGSLGYMAPELEMGVAASSASDWYALGVIVFKLLTGTWCDARTDVVADLDSYNPVWQCILPKLLHANPDGRECLSWSELRKAAEEQAAVEAENALLAAETKALRMRRRFFVAMVAAGVSAVCAGVGLTALLRPPMIRFGDIVRIPAGVPVDDSDSDTLSRSDFAAAQIDAWVLTHALFDDLQTGAISRESAVAELSRLAHRAARDDDSLFPDYYDGSGDTEALAILLNTATTNLQSRVRK